MWWALFVVFLYPFWCSFLNRVFGWDVGELYTFGLELKDFITAWIALGGIVGVTLNIFLTRTRITKQEEQFNRQYGKQVEQIEVQQRQLLEQEKQRRDARFASGVELLGNPHESTRIGGAYNLYFLARDFEEYREPVCEILCAHLRMIATKDKFEVDDDSLPTEEAQKKYPKNEVQGVVDLLFRKLERVNERENAESIFLECRKDLREVFLWKIFLTYSLKDTVPKLKNIVFDSARLTDVGFWRVELFYVDFWMAELTEVDFRLTKLKNVMLSGAKLANIRFQRAELTSVNFFGAVLFGVDFSTAELKDNIDFARTTLENCSYEEIRKHGLSLKLTANKETSEEITK